MSEPATALDLGQCDLCGRAIESWEWDRSRWNGQAEAQVFGSELDDSVDWMLLRCSHCVARTAVTEGGEG